MLYFYLDESGDLGFDFVSKKLSEGRLPDAKAMYDL